MPDALHLEDRAPAGLLSAALVASSPLPARRRAAVLAAALDAWPFLRPAAVRSGLANVVLRAPDTSGPGVDDVALERAFTQNEAVYDALPGWSAAHPDATFALVEVESIDGRSRYGGYVCRGGRVVTTVLADDTGDRALLAAVRLDLGMPLVAYLSRPTNRG